MVIIEKPFHGMKLSSWSISLLLSCFQDFAFAPCTQTNIVQSFLSSCSVAHYAIMTPPWRWSKLIQFPPLHFTTIGIIIFNNALHFLWCCGLYLLACIVAMCIVCYCDELYLIASIISIVYFLISSPHIICFTDMCCALSFVCMCRY